MFDCDFNNECFSKELEDLLDKECEDYEKYEMVHIQECKVFFKKQFEDAYIVNKQILGIGENRK